MGFHAMKWAAEQTVGSPTRKLVLLVIAEAADDDSWETFAGQETIASNAEVTVRTVGRALSELEGMGVIERRQRRRPDGYRTSDLIRVISDWASPDGVSPEECSPEARSHDNGSGDSLSPDNEADLTGISRQPHPTESRSNIQPVDQSIDQSDASPALRLIEDPGPSATQLATQQFEEEFWPIYPKRKGRRGSKQEALKLWLKLSKTQRRNAVAGAIAYGAHCIAADEYPKDAEGFLRKKRWDEWLTSDEPPRLNGSNGHGPTGRVSMTADERAQLGITVGASS